jgi:hypothetical protein
MIMKNQCLYVQVKSFSQEKSNIIKDGNSALLERSCRAEAPFNAFDTGLAAAEMCRKTKQDCHRRLGSSAVVRLNIAVAMLLRVLIF